MLARRDFLKFTTAGMALASLAACTSLASKPTHARVVVIGGGFAGSTVAKYLRMWSRHRIEVVVIEPNTQFISCPLSNLVLGGSKQLAELSFSYQALQTNHGIGWIQDEVTAIDPSRRRLTMQRGELAYDRLVIAPGIDFIYDQLPMLQGMAARQKIPHAWKAGRQTLNLRQQLTAMADGGSFVMSIPLAPFRCPPGPYERVSQVAFYFRQHKPRSKIIVLDANPDIVSKAALFKKSWAELYPGMIDYRANSSVVELDVGRLTLQTEFETVRADVLNLIPPQRAGKPAQMAGAVNIDQRWCGVDFLNYASKVLPHVHIVGDAIAAGLPKSAHMANAQAHVCASAIIAELSGQPADPAPVFANTCYSFVSDRQAMHVAHVYRYDADKKIMLAAEGGGLSERPSAEEGQYAYHWANNIWSDALT